VGIRTHGNGFPATLAFEGECFQTLKAQLSGVVKLQFVAGKRIVFRQSIKATLAQCWKKMKKRGAAQGPAPTGPEFQRAGSSMG